MYTSYLDHFRSLKQLTKIDCKYFDTIENIDEVFVPLKIIELSIYEVKNAE
jgi:hypothetical protein